MSEQQGAAGLPKFVAKVEVNELGHTKVHFVCLACVAWDTVDVETGCCRDCWRALKIAPAARGAR